MYVWVHMSVYMHTCLQDYVYLCVHACGRQRLMLNIFLSCSLPLYFEEHLSREATACWFLPGSLIEPPVFVFSELGLQAQCTQLFYGGAGDLIQVLIPTHKALHRLSILPSSGIAYLIEWGNELDMVYQRDRTIPNSQKEWHGFWCHYLCHHNHECTP